MLDLLRQLHDSLKGVSDGEVATYIPELAKADPDAFGICLVTATGTVYEVGDSQVPFTIQSISKPFVYGLALEDNGRGPVLEKVGVEPTGDAFNSISLEPGSGRPRNPMINAGAIAAAGMIEGRGLASRFKRVQDMLSDYAGRALPMDESVYRSESETGHRNRAIGYMLRNYNILSGDPIQAVELYFQQCSVSVTCRDLGVMAATLANRGVNPVTGRQAIRGQYVENVLSVMGSCGMYDYAGEWIYNVGIPAKSGVAGGVIAVLPGQVGIGVYSPTDHRVGPLEFDLCRDLTASEVDLLSVCLVHKRFAAGETIITAGDPAAELYFLVRGTVSVLMVTAGGRLSRLATFSPGMTFGEMAVIDRAPRSATIVADTEVECQLLSLEALDGLRQSAPEVCIKLLMNLSRTLSQKLRKANRELSVLD